MFRHKLFFSGVIFLLASVSAFANESYQSLSRLQSIAKDYLGKQLDNQPGKVKITVGDLDHRLRLAKCKTNDIEAFLAPGATALRSTTVGLRCNTIQKPWRIYIPVKVKILTSVIVATHHLPRGSRLKSRDLKMVEYDIHHLPHGYYQSTQAVLSQVVKHTIPAGQPITPYNIQAPQIIHRGESIIITAKNSGFQVNMHGVALMDGRLGETIAVKSKSSKRVLEARVMGRKRVQVVL